MSRSGNKLRNGTNTSTTTKGCSSEKATLSHLPYLAKFQPQCLCLSVYLSTHFTHSTLLRPKPPERQRKERRRTSNAGTEQNGEWARSGVWVALPCIGVRLPCLAQCVPCQGCGCSCTDGWVAVGQETVLSGTRNQRFTLSPPRNWVWHRSFLISISRPIRTIC